MERGERLSIYKACASILIEHCLHLKVNLNDVDDPARLAILSRLKAYFKIAMSQGRIDKWQVVLDHSVNSPLLREKGYTALTVAIVERKSKAIYAVAFYLKDDRLYIDGVQSGAAVDYEGDLLKIDITDGWPEGFEGE